MRVYPLIAVLCLLLLPGCSDLEDVWGTPQDRAKYSATGSGGEGAEPFEIGPASQWAEPGLYLEYARSHNVALKSGNGMLVAILLVSPETGETVTYDRLSGLFRDPHSGETFTDDGVKWGGAEDRPSLPRCRIREMGQQSDPDVKLLVDPSKLFRQEDREWTKDASFHRFFKPGDESKSDRQR